MRPLIPEYALTRARASTQRRENRSRAAASSSRASTCIMEHPMHRIVAGCLSLVFLTAGCSADSGTGPSQTYANIAGSYAGSLVGLSQGIALASTFSVTITQASGTLTGSYALSGTLTDGISSVDVFGTGALTGTCHLCRSPDVSQHDHPHPVRSRGGCDSAHLLTYHMWYSHNMICGVSRSTAGLRNSSTWSRRISSSATRSGWTLPRYQDLPDFGQSEASMTKRCQENGKVIAHRAWQSSTASFIG